VNCSVFGWHLPSVKWNYSQCWSLFDNRMPMAVRSFSAPTVPRPKGQAHKEKTFIEAWCMDVGVSLSSVIVESYFLLFYFDWQRYHRISHFLRPTPSWVSSASPLYSQGELACTLCSVTLTQGGRSTPEDKSSEESWRTRDTKSLTYTFFEA
jgi:hypothetical protein